MFTYKAAVTLSAQAARFASSAVNRGWKVWWHQMRNAPLSFCHGIWDHLSPQPLSMRTCGLDSCDQDISATGGVPWSCHSFACFRPGPAMESLPWYTWSNHALNCMSINSARAGAASITCTPLAFQATLASWSMKALRNGTSHSLKRF